MFRAGLIVIAIRFAFLKLSPGSSPVYTLLGNTPDSRGLFAATLGAIDNRQPLDMLEAQLDRANAAVVFAAVSLALAASSIGIAAQRLSGEADLPALNRLTQQLDLILLLGAIVLAIGVISIKQWHTGPLPFIIKENTAAYSALTAAYLAFQSVCYVGVLTFIYLPAALLLQSRHCCIDPAPTEEASRGTNPAFLSLFRVVALPSPVLVGPLASVAALKLA